MVVPLEVDAVDPDEPDDPDDAVDPDERGADDELLEVRLGAAVTGALETGASELTGVCSAADIESIGSVGDIERALSTGELFALLHAPNPTATAKRRNLYFMCTPFM